MPKRKIKAFPLFNLFNPLSGNVEYTQHDTVVTLDSCNSRQSENSEQKIKFSCKSLKSPIESYAKLCNSIDPFLKNCVTKSNF